MSAAMVESGGPGHEASSSAADPEGLLGSALIQYFVATVCAAFGVSLLFLLGAVVSAPGSNDFSILITIPAGAVVIGTIAFLIGILPAMLICAPLSAGLLRLGLRHPLWHAAVGAVPGLLLLALSEWPSPQAQASGWLMLAVPFLVYGSAAGLLAGWWLRRRFAQR
ncbi:MAG: hypothetical protein MEQ07_01485 [Aquimonas sp.]|nr:hypothetical protein [Aquimonas sp.]